MRDRDASTTNPFAQPIAALSRPTIEALHQSASTQKATLRSGLAHYAAKPVKMVMSSNVTSPPTLRKRTTVSNGSV